jgi:hypothetical protein
MASRSRTSLAKMAEKDQLENEPYAEVCAGKMLLGRCSTLLPRIGRSAGSNT